MADGFVPNDPFGAPGQTPNDNGGDFDFDMADQALLPEGKYEARCVAVETGTSQAGNPQLIWDFLVIENGKTIRSWTALTPGAKWKVVEYAAAFGVIIDPNSNRLKFNKKDVIGSPCIVTVEHRKYNGTNREGIKKVEPRIGEGQVLPPGTDIPF